MEGTLIEVPAWVRYALAEVGTHEAAGAEDHPRIRWYHAATAAGAAPDSVPWCSSFVNRMLACAGVEGTRSKAASSWLTWGTTSRPRVGAVCVIAHPGNHVGFWLGDEGGYVHLLGGNQANGVNIMRYPRGTVRALRWPEVR